MFPAMLHGSAALAPWRIAIKTQLGESIQRGRGLGKGQVEQEGAQVQQEGAQVRKKGSHL